MGLRARGTNCRIQSRLQTILLDRLEQDAGRADEATTVYAEARAYFDTAMAAVEADSKEAAYIQGELAAIPAPAPVTSP